MASPQDAASFHLRERENFRSAEPAESDLLDADFHDEPHTERSSEDLSGVTSVRPPAGANDLQEALGQLSRLVANVTEAYTAAIFLANPKEKFVQLASLHTLSREVVPMCRIAYGCGLVGWTAQNAVRISVCPFEHDATTLMYYSADQALKSFIAVPILSAQNELLGVISCDSKKSYAFAKITEKILLDCAAQAATMITLYRKFGTAEKKGAPAETDHFQIFLDHLRNKRSERELLEAAANLPIELVDRDALVLITTDEPGASASAFYSPSNQIRVGNRLLEHVCRHKRVICGERSVQAQTADDGSQRSFLSIPFHISKREAGSINLLSRAFEAFSAQEIGALEQVAQVVGRELEFLRLKEKYMTPEAATGLLTWEQFSKLAKNAFPAKRPEQRAARQPAYSLIRLALTAPQEIEDFFGVETTRRVILKIMRLVEQAKGSHAIAGSLYGSQMLILSERTEGDRIAGRLKRLLERFSLSDENAFEVGNRERFDRAHSQPGLKLHEVIGRTLVQVKVESPQDGETLEELLAKSNRLLETSGIKSTSSKSTEVIAHASNC